MIGSHSHGIRLRNINNAGDLPGVEPAFQAGDESHGEFESRHPLQIMPL